MTLTVLENEDSKLKIKVPDMTLINLINDSIWQQRGIEISAYATEHPYLGEPVLLVKAKNPKKALLEAAQKIVDDVKDLRKQFQNAVK